MFPRTAQAASAVKPSPTNVLYAVFATSDSEFNSPPVEPPPESLPPEVLPPEPVLLL